MRILVMGMLAVAVLLGACDGESMSVRLVNDTALTVDFLQCKSADCEDTGGRSGRDRKPGESYSALVSVGATPWYRIDDESGHTIGCLLMEFDSLQDDVQVLASQARGCP